MSRGVLDERAHKAAVQAVEAAAKRGERVVGMTALDNGRYSFETVAIDRKPRPEPEMPRFLSRRGLAAAERATKAEPQGSLL